MDKQIEINQSLKLIAKSSIIVFISIILSKIFLAIYRIIIARTYGSEIYGLFSLALMISGILILFANFGLNEGLLRYISIFSKKNQLTHQQYIYRFSLKVLLITSIITAILLFLLSDIVSVYIFNEPALSIFLKIFSLTIPLTVLFLVYLPIIRAYEQITWHSFIYNILLNGMKIIAILIFIWLGLSHLLVPWSRILGIFSALVVSFLVVKYKFPHIFKKPEINQKQKKKILHDLTKYSWPLLFYGLLWNVFHWTDSFVIGIFQTASDVGIYNAAVPITFFLLIPFSLFVQLFFPIAHKEYSKNKQLVAQLSKQIGKWVFALMLPLLILLMLFPGAFLNLLFGQEYIAAENSLRFLSIGVFIFSLFQISNRLLAADGKSKLLLIDTLIATILNIILNVLFVPIYGITGAAIATMISLTILSLLFLFQSAKLLQIVPLRRKMVNITLAAIISTAILILLRNSLQTNIFTLALMISTFILVYILMALLLKGFDNYDIMILKSVLNKINKK